MSVVKALAGRKIPSSVAHAFAGSGAEVVVVERYGGVDASVLEQIERDARAAMTLRHPNVVLVRDVWREKDELSVACEYVEGETLEELRKVGTDGKALSLEVGVRVVVDILGALSAIHSLASGGLSHGEVTATNAIVGFDGVTRLARPYRGRVAGKVAEADWFSYAAPEVIRGGAADVRADLYAVGVLLWETLSRRKLFPKATREGRAARTMAVGKPTLPADASWATPLAAVAERALANDPAARYTTAAEMAAAVRLAVRSKLAMPPRVAAAVDKLAGEKILARRNANALPDASETGARISLRPSRPPLPPEATNALAKMRASSRPPTPKPGAVAPVPAIPKTPALPSIEPRTGPRPAAPPLKLADPAPKPKPPPPKKPEPAPISVDAAFAEEEPPTKPITAAAAAVVAAEAALPTTKETPKEVAKEAPKEPVKDVAAPIATPEPMPAPPVVPAEAIDAAIVPAGVPNKKGGRTALIAAAVLVALIAIGAVVKVALGPSTQATTTPTTTATATATTKPTTTAATTVTATATATTTASAPADSATATEPEPSATGATPPPDSSSRRSRTRPRPTYDPMGI